MLKRDRKTARRIRNGQRHPSNRSNKAERFSIEELLGHLLLSSEQECDLIQKILRGREIEQARQEGRSINNEEYECVIKEANAAKEKLLNANIRLIYHIARNAIAHNGCTALTYEDLFQEGVIGLLHAIDLFDPKHGVRFSTYATWWIKQAIRRSIANKSAIIRIPSHVIDQLTRLRRAIAALTQELGREPTIEEIAHRQNLSRRDLLRLMKQMNQVVISLDQNIGNDDEDDRDIHEIIGGNDDEIEEVHNRVMVEQIKAMIGSLHGLHEIERQVIVWRLGTDGVEKSISEIAYELCVSEKMARKIVDAAIERLRKLIASEPGHPQPIQ